MYQPESYGIALLMMLLSMICWGSWANTMKLTPGWRFQHFYWDYVLGVLLMSLVWGLTLGSTNQGPQSFVQNLRAADSSNIIYALLGGVVFNVANLLLVAAIEIAGLAVAFPVGIGLALVEGVVINYILAPKGNPYLLFGGLTLVVLAIVCDALAYRRKEAGSPNVTTKGIFVSLLAGVLMGLFYPFVTKALTGTNALGPYTVGFVFAVGILLCTIPANYMLMRRPITGGEGLTMQGYFAARGSWHVYAILGGLIWCTGTVLNFVAGRAQLVGPAVSYGIGNGATMVSAVWGIVVWKEFSDAPAGVMRLVALMFVLFLAGLGAIAVAPLWGA
jgi:glucose uptake protein